MGGFFAYYGALGLVIFLGSLIIGLMLSFIFSKFLKNFWVFPITMTILAVIFYFFAMTFTAFLYLIIAIFISLFLIVKKNTKNETK
jgi:hypothetical protein